MRFKPGVSVREANPQIVLGLMVADTVYRDVQGGWVTVTSIRDGEHSAKSKHWRGDAADLRTRNIPPTTIEQIAAEIRAQLGKDFDVIVESDHIHLEFDPKGKA